MPINFLDFEKGLPNENFPSDHIYLFTEFQFCNYNKQIPFYFDKIFYDKNLNYELSLKNDDKNNQNVKYNKNEKEKNNDIKNVNTINQSEDNNS